MLALADAGLNPDVKVKTHFIIINFKL